MFNIELSSIDRCGHFVRNAADELVAVVRHDEDTPKPVPAAEVGVPIGTPAATGTPDRLQALTEQGDLNQQQ